MLCCVGGGLGGGGGGVFFFQAEDGIRDAQESRGLGDVYKRQNEDILMSKADSDQREAFYEAKIEPFLLALSLELTNKIFTSKQRGFLNEIMFESNRMSYMSMN